METNGSALRILAPLALISAGLVGIWLAFRRSTPRGALPCAQDPSQAHCQPVRADPRKAVEIAVTMELRDLPQIREAYDRNNGASVLGQPAAPAVAIKGGRGFVQAFEGNSGQPAAIFYKVGEPAAFVVRGGFLNLYTHLGGIKLGWPLEDEYQLVVQVGMSQTAFQVQRFSSGIELRWNSGNGRLLAKWNRTRTIFDSRPPPRKQAWYESTWAAAALYIAYPPAGIAAIVAQDPERAKEVAVAIATDPDVLLAVGLGVVASVATVATAGLAAPITAPVIAGSASTVAGAVVNSGIKYATAAGIKKVKAEATAGMDEGKRA